MDAIANPHLSDVPGVIIAFPDEASGPDDDKMTPVSYPL
jgi:hypothetical protein